MVGNDLTGRACSDKVQDVVPPTETSDMAVVTDVHAHAFPRPALAALRQHRPWHGFELGMSANGRIVLRSETATVRMDSSAFYGEPVERRLEIMGNWRVDKQVLSVSPVLFGYQNDPATAIAISADVNDDIADMVATWPERFAGLATLPMQAPAAAVTELERSMTELGLVGACVGTHVNGLNWDEDELQGVLEAAESLGALLFVHPCDVRIGAAVQRYHLRNTIGYPLEATIAVASFTFGGVLDRFPELKLCFAHGGGFSCWGTERFDHAHRVRADARERIERPPSEYLSRLHFDCLTHSYRNLHMLLDAVGASQVVLGTEFPADMGQQDPVSWLAADDSLDEATRTAVLGGNAQRLLAPRS